VVKLTLGMARISTAHLKVERAKVHFDALEQAIAAFRAAPEKSHRITSYDDLESGMFVIRGEGINDEIPLRIGLIAGDFVSNLRASMDHTIWALAALTTGRKPSNEICFPIVGQDSLDAQLRITRSTYGISDEAISIVKSLQPYNSGNGYQSTHLWRLHRLWNVDKHRSIALHSMISDEMLWLPRTASSLVKIEPLPNGAIMRFPISLKEKMRFDPGAGIDIRFGSDDEGIVLYVNDFIDIYEFVSKEVIPRFDRFFP
jgi:hypothetical protein